MAVRLPEQSIIFVSAKNFSDAFMLQQQLARPWQQNCVKSLGSRVGGRERGQVSATELTLLLTLDHAPFAGATGAHVERVEELATEPGACRALGERTCEEAEVHTNPQRPRDLLQSVAIEGLQCAWEQSPPLEFQTTALSVSSVRHGRPGKGLPSMSRGFD